MVTVYATVPPGAAADLARTLVEERLAACVNAVDCRSTYRWDGGVETDDETILLAKTTENRADALVDRLAEAHPYEVPCIERFEEASVETAFADWRTDAVSPTDPDPEPEPRRGSGSDQG